MDIITVCAQIGLGLCAIALGLCTIGLAVFLCVYLYYRLKDYIER